MINLINYTQIISLFLICVFSINAQQQYKDTCYVNTYFGYSMNVSTVTKNSFFIVNLDSMTEVPVYNVFSKWSTQKDNGVWYNVNADMVFDTFLVQAGRHYGYCHYIIYVFDVRLKRGNPIVMDSVHNSFIYYVDSPLPVELISFSGVQKGKEIKLKWRTETEINNYGFEVERKFTFTNWEKIGFVQGNSNSNSPKNYSYIDSLEVGKKEIVLYRLKQIDNDGTYKYHTSIMINLVPINKGVEINIYPNPFNLSVDVRFIIPNEDKTYLRVYNILGELINERLLDNVDAVKINFANKSSGIYLFVLESEKFIIVKKGILLK